MDETCQVEINCTHFVYAKKNKKEGGKWWQFVYI